MAQNLTSALKDLYDLETHFGMRSDNDNGLLDVIDELRLAAGINDRKQVNDCETSGDWTESNDGVFDMAVGTTGVTIGTNALSLTATTGANGDNVSTNLIDGSALPPVDNMGNRNVDWRRYDYIGGWNYGGAATYGTASELEIGIQNRSKTGAVAWSANQDMNDEMINAIHKRWSVDISALTRNAVEQIRFINQNETASDVGYVDEIEVYKFCNGWGPFSGACIWLPVQSAITLAKGNIAQVTVGTTHRLDSADANSVTIVGPTVIGGTGNAAGSVLACVQASGLAYLQANAANTAGEALQFVAGDLVADAATGEMEEGFATGLEAAGAQYDVIACWIGRGLIEV